MASLPGSVLKGDHTFWVCIISYQEYYDGTHNQFDLQITKKFSQLGGVSTHVAMYSMVNELEQCQAQALTLTKSIEGCYKGVASGLAAHGHKPTELLYTDNAQAEIAFHEKTTASLRRNVSHVVIDPYGHLPILNLPANVELHYYNAPDLIDVACFQGGPI